MPSLPGKVWFRLDHSRPDVFAVSLPTRLRDVGAACGRALLPERGPGYRGGEGPARGVGHHAVDVQPQVDALALRRGRDVDGVEVPDGVSQAVLLEHASGAAAQAQRRTAIHRRVEPHSRVPAT